MKSWLQKRWVSDSPLRVWVLVVAALRQRQANPGDLGFKLGEVDRTLFFHVH